MRVNLHGYVEFGDYEYEWNVSVLVAEDGIGHWECHGSGYDRGEMAILDWNLEEELCVYHEGDFVKDAKVSELPAELQEAIKKACEAYIDDEALSDACDKLD